MICVENQSMLDEVDWILHPLKSELNWPLGVREPLDLSYPVGLRWQLPWHLCDAILQFQRGGQPEHTTDDWRQSRHALDVLEDINKVLTLGIEEKVHFIYCLLHCLYWLGDFFLNKKN